MSAAPPADPAGSGDGAVEAGDAVDTAEALATQERLLGLVRESPGSSIQELARRMGLARTSVVYHIQRLARQGRIATVRQGTRALVFPAKTDPLQRGLLGALRSYNARALATAIRSDPKASWRRLARELALTPRTIRWHVARLEDAGLLRVVEEAGRRHLSWLHPRLAEAVAEAQRSGGAEPPADVAAGPEAAVAESPAPEAPQQADVAWPAAGRPGRRLA